MSTVGINLWVISEPFSLGVLPMPPQPRLSPANIQKILHYAKKAKSGFPNISYSVWKHIACNKLELSQDLAWLYFSTCDMLIEQSTSRRIQLDEKLAACSTPQERDRVLGQQSVSTLKFVLFLFIQKMQKISLRSNLLSGDEWPSKSGSSSLEMSDGRSTPRGSKSLDEHAHTHFVLSNLNEMIELLGSGELPKEDANKMDAVIPFDVVDALGFLIGGSVNGNKNVKSLADILLADHGYEPTGFSEINLETTQSRGNWKLLVSRRLSCRSFEAWVRVHLGANPFGAANCLSHGGRLSWHFVGEDKEARNEQRKARIITNTLSVPHEHVKGNRLIIMSQVNRQTIGRCAGTLENASIKINHCRGSQIYLLAPLRSVHIEKCHGVTVVLGAVETMVHVVGCDQMTIIAACRRFAISGSSSCTCYLLTPMRPLIFAGNVAVSLAPYHTFYPLLNDHMTSVGLGSQVNLWDQPLILNNDTTENAVGLLDPKDFNLFTIPFEMSGSTNTIPGGLPDAYHDAVMEHEKVNKQWHQLVKDSKLTREQRAQLQSFVEASFQEWLLETGYQRELDGLVPCTSKH